jgi:hypothetical protein
MRLKKNKKHKWRLGSSPIAIYFTCNSQDFLLAIIQLCKSDLGIGIDDGLLVDYVLRL